MYALVAETFMKIQYLSLFFLPVCTCFAASDNHFSQAIHTSENKDSKLEVSLSFDQANDSIDIFDIKKNDGGYYSGGNIAAKYTLNDHWKLEAAYAYRKMDYAKAINTIHSPMIGIQYFPDLGLSDSTSVMFEFSIWGNLADQYQKNTSTKVNKYRFNEINVIDPYDWQLQLDSVLSHQLTKRSQINSFFNIGYSQVKINHIEAKAKIDGCLLDINIQSNNTYTGKLIEPCIQDNSTVNRLNVKGSTDEFGLDFQKDLNYDAIFTGIGGSWNWRYKNLESQLGYEFQRVWRNDVDDRTRNFSNFPVKENHTIGAKLSYDFTPKIATFISTGIYQHNYIAKIPLFYNSVTSSRFDKRYGFASIGLTFRAF